MKKKFTIFVMYVLFSKLFKIKEFDFYCSKLKRLIIKKCNPIYLYDT